MGFAKKMDKLPKDFSEGIEGDFSVTEAILEAKPVEEIVDFDGLDSIGQTIERILSGTVEEKFEALVVFNEHITTNLQKSRESLVKNSLFISRTFADVLDGLFERITEFPPKFLKYLVLVFKKWLWIDFIIQEITQEELLVLVEVRFH